MEHILQTLIDNSSLRKGLLFHMENLQAEKQLLSSLEAPSEAIKELIAELKVLHRKDAVGEANKTTGKYDSCSNQRSTA